MLSLSVSCIHLELSAAKSPKEQALVLSMILFQRGRKMSELCATRIGTRLRICWVPAASSRGLPGFRQRRHAANPTAHSRWSREPTCPLSIRCKNCKRQLAAKPQLRLHLRHTCRGICCRLQVSWWSMEVRMGKPQFTRLDVAIGSFASIWPRADHVRLSSI